MDKNSEVYINSLIEKGTRKKCSCGSEYFDTATVQVEISAFSSPTGKDEILLVGVLVCKKCGKENETNKIIT